MASESCCAIGVPNGTPISRLSAASALARSRALAIRSLSACARSTRALITSSRGTKPASKRDWARRTTESARARPSVQVASAPARREERVIRLGRLGGDLLPHLRVAKVGRANVRGRDRTAQAQLVGEWDLEAELRVLRPRLPQLQHSRLVVQRVGERRIGKGDGGDVARARLHPLLAQDIDLWIGLEGGADRLSPRQAQGIARRRGRGWRSRSSALLRRQHAGAERQRSHDVSRSHAPPGRRRRSCATLRVGIALQQRPDRGHGGRSRGVDGLPARRGRLHALTPCAPVATRGGSVGRAR